MLRTIYKQKTSLESNSTALSQGIPLNIDSIPFQPALKNIQIRHRGQNALLTDLEIPRNCEFMILYLL